MTDNLENTRPYPPYASLVITGKELNPENISNILGIRPHKSHKRHEKKKDGIREWSIGSWIISSENEIKSIDVNCHIEWLLDQLNLGNDGLKTLSSYKDLEMKISVFWIMPSTNENLTFSPEMLNRLAKTNIKLDFDLYSPRDLL